MKKTVFFATMLMFGLFATAQNYKDISNFLLLKQYKQAKDELDKKMPNEKFAAKADAYILKTAIYAALATDSAFVKSSPQGGQLLTEAEAAWEKYKQMDGPTYPLLKELVYKDAPVNLYSALFNKAYKDYQSQNWDPAFQTFKKVSAMSDILTETKVLNTPVDTTVLILTAYTGETSNHKDEAAIYYTKLADAKVGGTGNEFIYRFLVLHAFEKNNMADFDKYKALGKQLYPTSEYFDYDKTDFAVGLSQSFETKLKAMEEVLSKDPNDYKANVTLAQLVYDTLHPKEGVPYANADALEAKMITSLTRAAAAKPADELVWLVMGDHFIDKTDKIDDARSAHVQDMKTRTKPGTQPSKADLQKRDDLDKAKADAFDKAREPYEKAAAIMATRLDKLTGGQKQQYRKVAGYLGDIYTYKKAQAKAPADVAKYSADAKKWNDLYDTLK
ncbi:MAG: hypothetical protein ABIR18_03085 [Chitinophagaceae bacterium]